jgi:hypothetical protein
MPFFETPNEIKPPIPPHAAHLSRLIVHSTDRVAWLKARASGITATDVSKLSTPRSVEYTAWEKLHGTGFGGNAYTDHGRAREPEIAAWVLREHGIEPSTGLYHAQHNHRHLATPDGIAVRNSGVLELAEIKTTKNPWRCIPRNYLRQVWWQQYVLGAERTLLVWELHENFVPVHIEPETRWIDRDETEIVKLVTLANQLLSIVDRSIDHQDPR